MAMIKRAICKAKRIDVQKERKKKKMSKIRMRRIPSGFSKARMIVSEARLLAAINASSFLKHLAIHIRSENKPLGNHSGKQKHGWAVHYNTTSAFDSPKTAALQFGARSTHI